MLGGDHENGKSSSLGVLSKGILPFSAKEKLEGVGAQKRAEDGMQWEIGTCHGDENRFEFKMALNYKGKKEVCEAGSMGYGPGPMALCYNEQMGWVAGHLSPKSEHWKRLARTAHVDNLEKGPNVEEERKLHTHSRVGTKQPNLEKNEILKPKHNTIKNFQQIAVRWWLWSSTSEPNECVVVELSRFRVTPRNPASL